MWSTGDGGTPPHRAPMIGSLPQPPPRTSFLTAGEMQLVHTCLEKQSFAVDIEVVADGDPGNSLFAPHRFLDRQQTHAWREAILSVRKQNRKFSRVPAVLHCLPGEFIFERKQLLDAASPQRASEGEDPDRDGDDDGDDEHDGDDNMVDPGRHSAGLFGMCLPFRSSRKKPAAAASTAGKHGGNSGGSREKPTRRRSSGGGDGINESEHSIERAASKLAVRYLIKPSFEVLLDEDTEIISLLDDQRNVVSEFLCAQPRVVAVAMRGYIDFSKFASEWVGSLGGKNPLELSEQKNSMPFMLRPPQIMSAVPATPVPDVRQDALRGGDIGKESRPGHHVTVADAADVRGRDGGRPEGAPERRRPPPRSHAKSCFEDLQPEIKAMELNQMRRYGSGIGLAEATKFRLPNRTRLANDMPSLPVMSVFPSPNRNVHYQPHGELDPHRKALEQLGAKFGILGGLEQPRMTSAAGDVQSRYESTSSASVNDLASLVEPPPGLLELSLPRNKEPDTVAGMPDFLAAFADVIGKSELRFDDTMLFDNMVASVNREVDILEGDVADGAPSELNFAPESDMRASMSEHVQLVSSRASEIVPLRAPSSRNNDVGPAFEIHAATGGVHSASSLTSGNALTGEAAIILPNELTSGRESFTMPESERTHPIGTPMSEAVSSPPPPPPLPTLPLASETNRELIDETMLRRAAMLEEQERLQAHILAQQENHEKEMLEQAKKQAEMEAHVKFLETAIHEQKEQYAEAMRVHDAELEEKLRAQRDLDLAEQEERLRQLESALKNQQEAVMEQKLQTELETKLADQRRLLQEEFLKMFESQREEEERKRADDLERLKADQAQQLALTEQFQRQLEEERQKQEELARAAREDQERDIARRLKEQEEAQNLQKLQEETEKFEQERAEHARQRELLEKQLAEHQQHIEQLELKAIEEQRKLEARLQEERERWEVAVAEKAEELRQFKEEFMEQQRLQASEEEKRREEERLQRLEREQELREELAAAAAMAADAASRTTAQMLERRVAELSSSFALSAASRPTSLVTVEGKTSVGGPIAVPVQASNEMQTGSVSSMSVPASADAAAAGSAPPASMNPVFVESRAQEQHLSAIEEIHQPSPVQGIVVEDPEFPPPEMLRQSVTPTRQLSSGTLLSQPAPLASSPPPISPQPMSSPGRHHVLGNTLSNAGGRRSVSFAGSSEGQNFTSYGGEVPAPPPLELAMDSSPRGARFRRDGPRPEIGDFDGIEGNSAVIPPLASRKRSVSPPSAVVNPSYMFRNSARLGARGGGVFVETRRPTLGEDEDAALQLSDSDSASDDDEDAMFRKAITPLSLSYRAVNRAQRRLRRRDRTSSKSSSKPDLALQVALGSSPSTKQGSPTQRSLAAIRLSPLNGDGVGGRKRYPSYSQPPDDMVAAYRNALEFSRIPEPPSVRRPGPMSPRSPRMLAPRGFGFSTGASTVSKSGRPSDQSPSPPRDAGGRAKRRSSTSPPRKDGPRSDLFPPMRLHSAVRNTYFQRTKEWLTDETTPASEPTTAATGEGETPSTM